MLKLYGYYPSLQVLLGGFARKALQNYFYQRVLSLDFNFKIKEIVRAFYSTKIAAQILGVAIPNNGSILTLCKFIIH